MTPTRYASTQVGQYLLTRFGFTFTDEEVFQPLEDHIWEAGRRAQVQRAHVQHICKALAEDIGYVAKSVEKGDRSPYEPNQRGDFQSGVRQCIELEREVSDLIGAHQGVVKAVRLVLSNVPTLEEHSQALGELRAAKAHRDQAKHQVTELLAARDEWARDEAELLRRLDEAEKALKVERAKAHGRAAALEENAADLAARVRELERSLGAERKAAEDFADERDDAQRKADEYRTDIERLEALKDDLEGDLADTKASLERSIDEYHEKVAELEAAQADRTRLANQHEELIQQVDALEKANQAR